MKLGDNIDHAIFGLKQWIYSTPPYKLRVYYGLKKMIIKNKFKNESHFKNTIIQSGWRQLYPNHTEKLLRLYYGNDNNTMNKFIDEAQLLWRKADERQGGIK